MMINECWSQSFTAWNLLADQNNGINWAGFDLVCEHLGITDAAALIEQLGAIKTHTPPKA